MHTFKIISSIVIMFSLIFIGSVLSHKKLQSDSEKLQDKIIQVETSSKDGSWQKASKEINNLKESWDSTHTVWALLIDHIEIDNIENSLTRLDKFVETKNTTLLLSEAASLRLYIGHIPEKEALTLRNVL